MWSAIYEKYLHASFRAVCPYAVVCDITVVLMLWLLWHSADLAGDGPQFEADTDVELSSSESDNEEDELLQIPRTRSQTRVSRSRSQTPDLTTPG